MRAAMGHAARHGRRSSTWRGPEQGESTQLWPTRWSAPRQGYLPGRRYGCWGTPCDTICITHRGRAYGPFVRDGRAAWTPSGRDRACRLAGRSDGHGRYSGRRCRPPNPAVGRLIGCGNAATSAQKAARARGSPRSVVEVATARAVSSLQRPATFLSVTGQPGVALLASSPRNREWPWPAPSTTQPGVRRGRPRIRGPRRATPCPSRSG